MNAVRCAKFHPVFGVAQVPQLVDFFIFILLSRESDGGAMLGTNPDSLRSCLVSKFSAEILLPTSSICCLLRFHQAEIIVVKHLI